MALSEIVSLFFEAFGGFLEPRNVILCHFS